MGLQRNKNKKQSQPHQHTEYINQQYNAVYWKKTSQLSEMEDKMLFV